MQYKNTKWFIFLVFAILAVTLACRAGVSQGDDSRTDAIGSSDDGTINVLVNDFSFSVSASQATAGPVTFVIENKGSMPHDFAIEGNGIEQKTSIVEAGESATLTVDLEPGAYSYICTIPGHNLLGMRGTFTVTSN
jgi:uncharacterized cupredoxin-like copper-binding protein